MATPLTVTTTPTQIIGRNLRRYKLFLQNVGNNPVYFKKQGLDGLVSEPSVSNYDFVLEASSEEDVCKCSIEFKSVAALRAVTLSGTSKIAIMETRRV